ncbi:MAG: calcium-translocating P-type ATPase, SERCA-type [Nanoarchaeota archaeon]|nr:calcium-translocating P-type ATPase, SERCA-type [Nanoarchaeota archaeon]
MFHNKTVKQVFEELHSSKLGLSDNQAQQRLKDYGPNELITKRKYSLWGIFFSGFKDIMVLILIGAAIVSFALGIIEHSRDELVDGVVIVLIVVLNAVIGFIQEFKAEKSLEALKKMTTPTTKVIRQGHIREIDARDLVPGDIVVLEEGDKIPADLRLIEEIELEVDAAALTGESTPEAKDVEVINKDNISVADMENMVFMGTIVVKGRGRGIVVSTGMQTEFGKIVNLTTEVDKSLSPLQKELIHVGKFIAKNVFVICAIVFVGGILMKNNAIDMFLLAVSLAVAAVPEGLPATVTIALALGVQRMAKKNAVIRKLNSVETLGSTTVICSDKTGTLTKNEMTVKKIFTGNKIIDVEGTGYKPDGKFIVAKKAFKGKDLEFLLRIGVLCNNAELTPEFKIIGDPTEGALVVSGEKYGFKHEQLSKEHLRLREIPFDSKRKMMSTVNKFGNDNYLLVKGAPDQVIEKCTHITINGKTQKLTPKLRKGLHKANDNMASDALRVLAFAYKKVGSFKGQKAKGLEAGLTFVGMQGMIDPPREEVHDAVATCKEAGIRIFVISGDFGVTTKAIAEQLGIADKDTKVITGIDLNNMKDPELRKVLQGKAIFARVDPEHKMRIVALLKDMGEIVSVTGDGVNDAPAIKKADIGVAMGITGTDVSKEASDMVLMDDSFATIVLAVKEGRGIYADIKKFLKYIFTSNLGEIMTVFFGMFLVLLLDLPKGTILLTATQILWINLGTDILPAIALGVDTPAPDIMRKPPRDPKKRIITKRTFMNWFWSGLIIAVGTLAVYAFYSANPMHARTMAFTTLVIFQMMNVFNCRSPTLSLFQIGFFTNKLLLAAVAFSVFLQAIVVHVPFLQDLFKTVGLSWMDWLVVVLVSSSVVIFEEIRKALLRKHNLGEHLH